MVRFKKNVCLSLLFLNLLTIETCSYASEKAKTASKPLPVLIDTDMAFDDWTAILYLLNSKKVEVKGIAVSGTGEAHCDIGTGNMPGATNALNLIKLADKENL